MKKISEDTFKKLAIELVNKIEEDAAIGGITTSGAIGGPFTTGGTGFGGTLSSVGSTHPSPTGQNATSKGQEQGTKPSATSNKMDGKKGKAAVTAATVYSVAGPLGRASESARNVPTSVTTLSGVKANIEKIGGTYKPGSK